MVLAAFCTLLIPETKGKTIEEIENGVLYGSVGALSENDGPPSTPTDSIQVLVDGDKKGEIA